MPELPEVETTVRCLKPKLLGRVVSDIWTDWPKVFDGTANVKELKNTVVGKEIVGIRRRGKNILLGIGNITLWIHLKMTGHLLFRSSSFFNKKYLSNHSNDDFALKVNQYIHFRLILNDGKELAFSDLRKFGRVRLIKKELNLIGDEIFNNLGVEPLDRSFNLNAFKKIIKEHGRKELKIFFLDQSAIAGIGNIYASEIPFKAHISPKRRMGSLNSDEIRKLFISIKNVLNEAIKRKGTSISDFRMPNGKSGSYQDIRKVYQKKGEKCSCGGVIESFKQGQRTTFWCPKCQS